MASSQAGKSKRTTEAQKARRARSWSRGQAVKKTRVREQDERARKNRVLRASGELTPWQQSEAERHARRKTKARDDTRAS